jgi:hypothetical protein
VEIPKVCPLKPVCTFLRDYDDPVKGSEALANSGLEHIVAEDIDSKNLTWDEYDRALEDIISFCKTNRNYCQLVRLEEARKLIDDSSK